MRATRLWTLFVLLLAACGGTDEPKGHALAPMDLVRVGTIGWHPDDIPGPVAILDLHRDGRMVLDGTEVASTDALREALTPLADAARDDEDPMRPSRLHLVVRSDRNVPWRTVQSALGAGADPENRIHRVLFGVLPLEGNREGTLGLGLPRDRCNATEDDPSDWTVLRVTLRARGPGGEPAALAAVLAAVLKHCTFPVSLDAGGDVPVGYVLRVADAAFRAGVPRIVLVWTPGPERTDPVTAASQGPVSIWVGEGKIPPGPAEELPPVPRVNGLAGSVGAFLLPSEFMARVSEDGEPIEGEDLPVEEGLGDPK